MEENEKRELPPKYYLEYFNYVLDFVQEKYRPILQTSEWTFLRKYYCLSEDAQCLFIRFSNRRTNFFRIKSLVYPEIEAIESSLEELLEKEFAEYISFEKHPSVANELLHTFTKPELLSLFEDKELKRLKKAEVVEKIIQDIDFQVTVEKVEAYEKLVKVNFAYEVSFMKFLFFGNRYLDMTEFVVRDLGYVQYYRHDDETLVARFENRKDAEDKWFLTDQNELFKQLQTTQSPAEIYDWFLTVVHSLTDLSEIVRPSLDRLILRVGRFLEREKLYEYALDIYQLTPNVPSRERQVRTLEKLKNNEEAKALCQLMLENPLNADEHFFANDCLLRLSSKKSKSKKSTTEELHQAESITISAMYHHQVEVGTIAHYIEKGKSATFAENHLWRAMFGLIFWDIIFDPTLVAFHHPFQRRPSDLHLPAFYEKRNQQIINHLDSFLDIEKLLTFMGNCYVKNFGTANPFVVWLDEIWDMVRKAVECIGLENTKEIVHEMAKNIIENSRGFPDLFVWDEAGNYEFVEVKSPTDTLSNQQLFWLQFFKNFGVYARVLRVYFEKTEEE